MRTVAAGAAVLAMGQSARGPFTFRHPTPPVLSVWSKRYHIMCVRCAAILGSGDIGLIMARRLTLGVLKSRGMRPAVCQRLIVTSWCLHDYDIPLTLHTVIEIMALTGSKR